MDMNIQKYMALVKTVEYGSFTKAAEILNYSQSGLIRIGTFSSAATRWLPNIIRNGIALRSKKTASLAVKRFLEYLQYR